MNIENLIKTKIELEKLLRTISLSDCDLIKIEIPIIIRDELSRGINKSIIGCKTKIGSLSGQSPLKAMSK